MWKVSNLPAVNINKPAATSTDSYFDGGLLQLIGWNLLGALVTTLTLGICYPWAFCMVYRWEAKHTVINGQRLRFDGTGAGLFGLWIKWLLLSIITLGIYLFWVGISLKKWKTKHTHFEN
jgi:uncharacterized membrane protein YjgN (DUF898 family)